MNLGLAKRDSSWIGVLPVRAATAAKETVDGEGGFGDGGQSLGSDREEFLGRPRLERAKDG
jgi:hypothetical protein